MKKNILLLLAFLSLGVAYTYWNDGYTPPSPITKKTSADKAALTSMRAAPDFSWHDLQGNPHRLSDIKDKVVIINFWATWCAPCAVEFPQMLALAKKTNEKSIFLFLSVDEHKEDIARFLKKQGDVEKLGNVYIGWDKDKSISEGLFGTKKYPESFILNPEHQIADKIIGADTNWSGSEMKEKINALWDASL